MNLVTHRIVYLSLAAAVLIGTFYGPKVWAVQSAKSIIAGELESPVTEFREVRRVGDLVCGQVATESHPTYRNFWVSGSVGMVAPGPNVIPEVFAFWFDNWSKCKA